jgi:hypothetical protein
MKKQIKFAKGIDYGDLWEAKCRAWKCEPIILWDDCGWKYPDGLGVTRDGQVFYISATKVKKVSLAQSLRIFRKRDAQEKGSSCFGCEGSYHWLRLMERALKK